MQLSEELESLRCERERHLSELNATTEERNRLREAIHSKASEEAENIQSLQTELQTVTEERDHLKRETEENTELVRVS